MTDELDRNLGFLLYDAARLMRRDFDRRARSLGLSRAQWSVLAHLARKEGVKQAELAEVLDVQPITLARQIDRLERSGLVCRRPDPEDRRVRRLYLSALAEPILTQLRALGRETRAEALRGLSQEQRRSLTQILARIRDNLSTNGSTLVRPKEETGE